MATRSTFYGIEIGKTGIYVSQKGLDVTGHNISNLDTEGYTRQRIHNSAYNPYTATMRFKNSTVGAVGGGAHVQILDQVRSQFLDRQFRTENTYMSYWDARVSGLSYVESLFEGTEASSISQGILDMFSAFNLTGTEANDSEQRTNLRSTALALCDNFSQVYDRLIDQAKTQDLAVETAIMDINNKTTAIAELNRAIYYYELDGQPAVDLRDKRNLLLDELSGLVDINYYNDAEGKLVVELSDTGEELVNYKTAFQLSTKKVTNPVTGLEVSMPCLISKDGVRVFTSDEVGGSLKANIQLRDSSNLDTPGIPYFIEQLDVLARAIAETVNGIHTKGWTHPANSSGTSQTGVNFFDVPMVDDLSQPIDDSSGRDPLDPDWVPTYVQVEDYSAITAKNFTLSAAVADEVSGIYNIAASDEPIKFAADGITLQQGNQLISKELSNIIHLTEIMLSDGTSIGSIYGFMSSIEQAVANTKNVAVSNLGTHNTQLLSVDTQRTSVAGVSLDEEMTSLIKYNHAYSGASRVITAMDEALDVLINRMGRVGL